MDGLSWIACLWPGLPRLWWRGDWRALLGAAAFAAALNLALLSSLVWQHSLPGWLLTAGWLAIGTIWLICAWYGWQLVPTLLRNDAVPEEDDLFVRAQEQYLSRHWLEAEELLTELLARQGQDAEARLLLATLYRHTDRMGEAAECLTRLERTDRGARWCVELARERQLLDRAMPRAARETGGDEQEAFGDGLTDEEMADEGTEGCTDANQVRAA